MLALIQVTLWCHLFLSCRSVSYFHFVFVCVEVQRPSQQFFSHVGTEPLLPGYYRYFQGVKCLAQGHNMAEEGLEPPTSRSANALPFSFCN